MKIVKTLIIALLISSCNKSEIVNDRNVLFNSDSLNVFGKLSDSRLIYPNIEYKLNVKETIGFDRLYTTNTNNFKVIVFVDGVKYNLNNDYFFTIK